MPEEKTKRKRSLRKPSQLFCVCCHKEAWREIRGARDDGRFCSRECYFLHRRKMIWEVKALSRIQDAWVGCPKKRAAEEDRQKKTEARRKAAEAKKAAARSGYLASKQLGTCRTCGGAFHQPSHLGRPTVDCPDCAKEIFRMRRRKYNAIRKLRGKAKRKGAAYQHIDPTKVFVRDGWVCHICKEPTDPSLRGSIDPKAPELEHIISLSDGGGHTWGNVACACRACNLWKGARSFGQIGFDFPVF